MLVTGLPLLRGGGFIGPYTKSEARTGGVKTCATKGFAKKSKKNSGNKEQSNQGKRKMQKGRTPQNPNPMAPVGPSPNSRDEQFQLRMEQMRNGSEAEVDEFKQRLADLKARGKSLKSQSVDEAQLDPLQGMDRLGPLDASPRSQGQQPRPRPSSVDDVSRSDSGLGIPQVAVGVITLALAAAFVVTSGALPGGSGGSGGPSQEISEEGLKALKKRSQDLEKQLKEAPSNVEAQRELADVTAILGDYKKSKDLAEQVVKNDAESPDSWYSLGDAKTRLKDWKGAAAAFEKSLSLDNSPTLGQYEGLASALVQNKQYAEAVEKLQSYESKAKGGDTVGIVEVQLLVAKVYSQWENHFSSALAVYDGLIEKNPNDFRIYLAKGKLLKDKGRKGEATRIFIQAKYLAPVEARGAVDQIANS